MIRADYSLDGGAAVETVASPAGGAGQRLPFGGRARRRASGQGGTASLEIHLHLADGSVSRLRQEDAAAIDAILARLHPERLFLQQHLIVAERAAVTLYPWSAVTRVDLITDQELDWPYPSNVLDWVEITAEEFAERRSAFPPRAELRLPPCKMLEAVAETEFVGRQRLFSLLRLRLGQQLPLDQSLLLHRFLSRPALHCRGREGSTIVMNPAHIVRLSIYPGPRLDPPDAWPAERLAG